MDAGVRRHDGSWHIPLRAVVETVTISHMQQSGGIVEPACPSSERMVTLPARPEAIRLAADQTALIVIDMQNAYASPGGYVDLAGFDITGAAGTIDRIAQVIETARAAGVQVEPDVHEDDNGRFGWIMDPEGTRIELWQPPSAKMPA